VEQDMLALPADRRVCQGTLLSWSQYLVHIERGEYEDARHPPRGGVSHAETRRMTYMLRREQTEDVNGAAAEGREEEERHYGRGEAHAA
jgi:hypothetical protein